MKTPQTLFTLLAALAVNLHAETQKPTKEALARLIAEIPPAEEMLRDVELEIEPEKAKSQDELSKAKGRTAKTKEAIAELRKRITLGSSVLDYPGLLADRRIGYSPDEGEYTFFVGARSEPNADPSIIFGFYVMFDEDGIITSVDLRDRGDEQREKADAVFWVESDFFEWAGYSLSFQKPGNSLPFSPELLMERMAAATTQRDMVVAIIDKRLRMRPDEELKKLADDLEGRLRQIGFKKVIFHLANGDLGTPIYRE